MNVTSPRQQQLKITQKVEEKLQAEKNLMAEIPCTEKTLVAGDILEQASNAHRTYAILIAEIEKCVRLGIDDTLIMQALTKRRRDKNANAPAKMEVM